ncbi:glyoxalase [Nocardia harenae]|uniref:glyoxalase n=1 Tax=Nocardia harenae TaxID=358707 RepID=UPI000B27BE4C|nr:glyoxalase [Nocardia harenae]
MADFAVPVMWAGELGETLDFYKTLGYAVTYEQTRPYCYGAVQRPGYDLHFYAAKDGDSTPAADLGCLVMVGEVEQLHAGFSAALRAKYGKVPARGIPRITRMRPGQTRFTVYDPAGNGVTYIRHDEPAMEYGGSSRLTGLAKVIDNARILRFSKQDDRAARRALESGLRKHGATATALERAHALADLVEIAVAEQDSARAAELRGKIAELTLTAEERTVIAEHLRIATDLAEWLDAD